MRLLQESPQSHRRLQARNAATQIQVNILPSGPSTDTNSARYGVAPYHAFEAVSCIGKMELTTGLSQLDQFGRLVQERYVTSSAAGTSFTSVVEEPLHALAGSGWGPAHLISS
jgi:hypothetical protein